MSQTQTQILPTLPVQPFRVIDAIPQFCYGLLSILSEFDT
jgi:hypothetical protein